MLIARCTLTQTRSPDGRPGLDKKGIQMADVAYVALTIAIFGLLALMLRGLEKLQ